MFKAIWHFLRAFFLDEDAFLKMSSKAAAQVRAVLIGSALGGVGFADDLARVLGDGSAGLVKKIKVAALVAGFLGAILRAGDKTPDVVKAMASGLTPPTGFMPPQPPPGP